MITENMKSPDVLERLHEIHVRRYASRMKAAEQNPAGFRVGELRHLLALWQEVKDKNFCFSDLSPEARCEVEDAIDDHFEREG